MLWEIEVSEAGSASIRNPGFTPVATTVRSARRASASRAEAISACRSYGNVSSSHVETTCRLARNASSICGETLSRYDPVQWMRIPSSAWAPSRTAAMDDLDGDVRRPLDDVGKRPSHHLGVDLDRAHDLEERGSQGGLGDADPDGPQPLHDDGQRFVHADPPAAGGSTGLVGLLK